MRLKIRQIINVAIALAVANIPTLFPEYHIMMGVYLLGLLTLFIMIYISLELFTKKGN